jgi:hypothetical protein
MAANNFKRDWPNPVSMDEKTIKSLMKSGLILQEEFVESPSLKYKLLVKGNSAIYNEGK